MRCHKCSVVAEEEDIYCRKCSTKIRFDEIIELCSCGRKLREDENFCPSCNKQIIPYFSVLQKGESEF